MPNSMIHLDPGIPLSNEDKNRINLIAGATTAPLLDAIWESTDQDEEVLKQFVVLLTTLYEQNQYETMLAIIRLTHGLLGLQVPEPIEQIATHSAALKAYLYEFLLDVDDLIPDYTD